MGPKIMPFQPRSISVAARPVQSQANSPGADPTRNGPTIAV
jgi:hypothetical protein